MLDELDWAAADLEHAKTLMQRSANTGKPIDEAWESKGNRWHISTWQGNPTPTVGDPESVTQGLWNVSLTANGPDSYWSFAWTGDSWVAT